jgi:acyl-CoA thioesterase-1
MARPCETRAVRRVLAASIVMSSLVPLACASAVAPSATPSPSASAPIRYVALGDSYTIGTSVAVNERFPNQLVERLTAQGTSIELVANLGVNGFTTVDLLAEEVPALGDLQADLVTVLIGVNDVVQDVPPEYYRANVAQILGALLAELPRERIVVVSTPDYTRTPRGADFGDPAQQRAGVATVNSIMAEEARARGIAFVDIGTVADLAGSDPTLVARDQLHPSGAQYARWVDLIAPVVAGMYGQPRATP